MNNRFGSQVWRLAGLLAVLVLLTAACGGGDPQPAPTEPEPTPTESEPTPTAPEPDPTPTEPEPTEPAEVSVEVYFSNSELGDPCGDVFPVSRSVDAEDPVAGAAEALLAGPTDAERAEGYGGWFSDETAGMVRSVRVDGSIARVDFEDLRPVIPNASTSCGSAALLAELDTTLEQFPEVADTRYSIEGDMDAFYEWLQLAAPEG